MVYFIDGRPDSYFPVLPFHLPIRKPSEVRVIHILQAILVKGKTRTQEHPQEDLYQISGVEVKVHILIDLVQVKPELPVRPQKDRKVDHVALLWKRKLKLWTMVDSLGY